MHIDRKHLVGTFVALLALTLLTFGLSFAPLGRWEPVVALGIAAVKASLVVAFFMHGLESRTSTRLVLATAVGMITLLVSFAALDVRTRQAAPVVPPDARPLGSPATLGSPGSR